MSEKPISTDLKLTQTFESCLKEMKVASSEMPIEETDCKNISNKTKIYEAQEAKFTKDDKNDKGTPTKIPEENPVKDVKLTETPEITKVCNVLKKESLKDIENTLEISSKMSKVTKMPKTLKTEMKNDEDNKVMCTKTSEKTPIKDVKLAETPKVTNVCEAPKKESSKDIEIIKSKTSVEIPTVTDTRDTPKTKSTKDDQDDKASLSKISSGDTFNVLIKGTQIEDHELSQVRELTDKDDNINFEVFPKISIARIVHDFLKTEVKDDEDDKTIPTESFEESSVKDVKLAEIPEVTKVCEAPKKESSKDIKNIKSETSIEIPTETRDTPKTESMKDDQDDKASPSKMSSGDTFNALIKGSQIEDHEVLQVREITNKNDNINFEVFSKISIAKMVDDFLKTEIKDDKDDKANPTKSFEESSVKDIKPAKGSEDTKVREITNKNDNINFEIFSKISIAKMVDDFLKTEIKDDKDDKANPTKSFEESSVKDIKPAKGSEDTKVREMLKKESKDIKSKDTKDIKLEISPKISKVTKRRETLKTEMKNDEDDKVMSTKTSEKIPVKNIKLAETPEVTKELKKKMLKEQSLKDIKDIELKIETAEKGMSEIGSKIITEIPETLKIKSTKDNKDNKMIPTKAPEASFVKDIKLAETSEITKERETIKNKESPKDIKDIKLETCAEIPKVTKIRDTPKTKSTKNIKDNKLAISVNDPEERYLEDIKSTEAFEIIKMHESQEKNSLTYIKDELKFFSDTLLGEVIKMKTESTKNVEDDSSEISPQQESNVKDIKSTKDANKTKKIPVLRKDLLNPWDLGARKIWRPISAPNLDERPLVLAIHLVPSLPIEFFEIFAEIIEVVTKKPVVLLYEKRSVRPVAKDVADIAILPAANDWDEGVLLPASFVFEHHLNKTNSPYIYADVIIGDDHAPHIENIMDLRGHRCALPNRCDKSCATSLLFGYLQMKGENPTFFGNILDGSSQLEVLRMIAGKQAEVGVLEAPVIGCQKLTIAGAEFLQILTSLGPLPPYRIMIKKALVNTLSEELTTYLLNINQRKEWMDRLSSFGVVGFAENSPDFYSLHNIKSVATSVPYY